MQVVQPVQREYTLVPGVTRMEFKRITKKVKLLSPTDSNLVTQEIEYREDPLTGSRCIINAERAQRAKQSPRVPEASEAVPKGTEEGCFFCPEQIEDKTPRFPANIHSHGKIKRGECTVFPNLFPFAEYHAVATLTTEHFLDLDRFNPQMIADNMMACQEWMLAVHRADNEARYPVYLWNHLPPSGASIVHPHVQALVRGLPSSMQEDLLSKSKDYFQINGRNYWADLIKNERSIGERFINENDTLAVIASYAPRGFREIQFIFKRGSSFTGLNEKQIRNFADAVAKVLYGYKELGVGSFNLSSFSGPMDEKPSHYSFNAKLISRPFPRGVYVNDTGSFERLQNEWVIETLPEHVAEKMQTFF